MTLNENKPNDATLFSELDDFQRETRGEVNTVAELTAGKTTGVQTITSIDGQTIVAGTQMNELLLIDVDATLSYITQANEGHLVYLKIRPGHSLTVNHSAVKTNGNIFLNGDGSNLTLSQYSMLALINIDGDQSSGIDGYWEEVERAIWV